MTAKDFLFQVRYLDQRVESKLKVVASLRSLAEKATTTFTGMPKNPSPSTSSLESTVAKISDLEEEIDQDVDALVDLKTTILALLKRVDDPALGALLEMHYVNFLTFEEIADTMHCSLRWIYKLHNDALVKFEVIMSETGID